MTQSDIKEKKQSFSSDGFENKQKTVSVICQVASEKCYTVTIADVEKMSRKQNVQVVFVSDFVLESFGREK